MTNIKVSEEQHLVFYQTTALKNNKMSEEQHFFSCWATVITKIRYFLKNSIPFSV